MTSFPKSSEASCQELLKISKESLFELATLMKIETLSEDIVEQIVIPIAYHVDTKYK